MRHIPDEVLIAYIEGDVGQGERLEIEEHLKNCPLCMANYTEYMMIIGHVEKMPPVRAPQELDLLIRTRIDSPAPLVWAFVFSGLVVMLVGFIIEWFPRTLLWFVDRLSLMVNFLSMFMKFYVLAFAHFDAGVFLGVMVVLSIITALILKRRLEDYVDHFN